VYRDREAKCCCCCCCCDLGAGDFYSVAVAHWTDVVTERSLSISLPEKLLHYTAHPLAVNVSRFRRVAQIGAVQQLLKHLTDTFRFTSLHHERLSGGLKQLLFRGSGRPVKGVS